MKILIIGVGSIGERHLKNLLKLGHKDISLCDFSAERMRNLEAQYRLPVHTDWRSALKEVRPDVTFICTSADSHVIVATAAVRGGSHVFIEKPLSVDLKGVDSLIRLAKKKKKTVMVACNWLFHGALRALQKALRDGSYGNPLLSRVVIGYYLPGARKNTDYRKNYSAKKTQGGGVILDSGSHAVNYLTALFGEVKDSRIFPGKLHALGIKAEEAAGLFLEHVNDVLSTVSLDYVSPKSVHKVEVVTDKGLLTLDFRDDSLAFEAVDARKMIYAGSKDLNLMYLDEVRHFFDCIRKRKKPIQDLPDAKKLLKILI